MANTLYEFYTGQGKALPSVQERQGIAKEAGISGYSGTAEQNNQLLSYLQKPAAPIQPRGPAATPPVQPPAGLPANIPPVSIPVTTTPTGIGPTATPAGLGLVVSQDPNQSAIDKAIADSLRGYTDGIPDQAKIEKDTIARFQTELDAIDKAAAEARTRITTQYTDIGNRRTGAQRALLNDSGMLGQVGGEAQKNVLESANAQELNSAVAAEQEKYDAQKRTLLSGARSAANSQYEAKLKAYSEGAAATVDYLRNKSANAKKGAVSLAKQALAAGIDLTDKKNSKDVEEYAKQLGVSVQDLIEAYQDAEAAQTTAGLENAKLVAEAKKAGQTTLNEGDILVDANGKVIAKGAGKNVTLSEGQKLFNAQGQVIAQGDPKIERQVIGNTLLERDANGNWRSIYTAPESVKGTIVKVNGTDYQVDADGNLKNIVVPEAVKQASETKKNALESAQALLKKLQDGVGNSAVGASRNFYGGIMARLPGTDAKDLTIQFDNLKSLLSLDNVKLLKGQGAVSDAERQLLADASAKLNLGQSESEFKKSLEDIIKGLSGPGEAPPAQGGGGNVIEYNGKQYQLDADGNFDPNHPLTKEGSVSYNAPTTGMRTDRHNNPAAFTVDVAKNAGLKEGVDYTVGDAFPNNPNLKTARLIGDPVAQTIKVIDKIGFYTQSGKPRWSYVASLDGANNWKNLSYDQKKNVIAQMYSHEGGSKLKQYFA